MDTHTEHPDAGDRSDKPAPYPSKSYNFWDANRVLIKAMVIGLLILVMLIPSAVISSLVKERANRQQEVIEEVSSKWAGAQTITGPVLMLPYNQVVTQADGKSSVHKKMAYFLPEQLHIEGDLLSEQKHRHLYQVSLYRSDLTLSGSFNAPDLAALHIQPDQVLWNDARLAMGLDDARGLEDEVLLQWNSASSKLESGIPQNEVVPSGLNAVVACNATQPSTFTIKLKVKGSEYIYFTPAGKTTDVVLHSPWSNPAFDGKYLPGNTEVSKNGFTAKWKILQASRPYPQAWSDGNFKLNTSAFGVRLLQPTDTYVKTERSVKYALLFIGLSFAVFFFIELLQKKQIHPLQYFLVGIALTVFYTLLLSISEYSGFNIAYAIATTATITLIGLYVWSIFKKGSIATGFTVALGALYSYIFFLIQLQDYALLFGSIGLFVVVALAMYSSRKVDWYQIGRKTPAGSS